MPVSLYLNVVYTEQRSVSQVNERHAVFFSGMKANCICPAIHGLSPQGSSVYVCVSLRVNKTGTHLNCLIKTNVCITC